MNVDFLKDWKVWAIAGGSLAVVTFLVFGGGGKVDSNVGDKTTTGDGNAVQTGGGNFSISKDTVQEKKK